MLLKIKLVSNFIFLNINVYSYLLLFIYTILSNLTVFDKFNNIIFV